MKVLLLEDDMILSEIITEYLEILEHEVTVVYDGFEAEDILYSNKFDILILDVNVPQLDGFSLLKSFRSTGDKTPVIFITSLHTSNDVQKGFDVGCDDYLKKPFDLIELKARLDNIKRHFHIDEKSIYKISDKIRYDSSIQTLLFEDDIQKIARKEAYILEYFLHHKDRVISIDEIISNIWSYEDAPSFATIRTYIKNLRKFIGESTITTIKGVGYRYNS